MDRFMRKCVMDRKIVQLLIQKKSFNKISKTTTSQQEEN